MKSVLSLLLFSSAVFAATIDVGTNTPEAPGLVDFDKVGDSSDRMDNATVKEPREVVEYEEIVEYVYDYDNCIELDFPCVYSEDCCDADAFCEYYYFEDDFGTCVLFDF